MENQPSGVMNSTKNTQQAPLMKPLLDQESKNLMNFLSLEKNDETKINSLIFEPDPTPQNDDQNNSANSLDSGKTDFKYVDVGNISKGELGLLKPTILTRPPRGTQLEKLIGNPNKDSDCGESIKKEESELQRKAKVKDQDLIQKRHKTNQRQRERKRERNSFNLKRENIEKLMEIKPIPVNMGSTKNVVFNSELFSLFNAF